MTKPEWGLKRVCQNCGAKFYDFNRKPVVCPKCDTEQNNPTPAKSKKAASRESEPKPREADNGDLRLDSDEDDDALMEDASDIGGDDMPKLEEHMDLEYEKT